LEVVEDRSGLRSTVLTSQLPVAMWHNAIREPALADSALDHLLENLQRVELQGDSMRKTSSGRAGSKAPREPQ
jgi:DNA replication protein DnaC